MADLSGYSRLDEAAIKTGITVKTLTRRIAAGELPAARDPRDRRRYLIETAALERLMTPNPVHDRDQEPAGTAA